MLNYHSYETFSTQDWPWIRMVFFLQWCPFRCLYCQNPDTISTDENKRISKEKILKLVYKEKDYFWKDGWVTFSWWECLLQIKELIPVLKLLKENWINTCLDTNGFLLNDDVKEALKYTDHVLPDIKWITQKLHKKVTWTSNMTSLDFIRYIDEQWMNYWIRYVVVPWLTNNEVDIKKVWEFIQSLKNFQKINLLKYHTMALEKRKKLWRTYPLKWVPEAWDEDIQKVKNILSQYIDIKFIQ
jgi:pyruvate formate lyase activating enzyme